MTPPRRVLPEREKEEVVPSLAKGDQGGRKRQWRLQKRGRRRRTMLPIAVMKEKGRTRHKEGERNRTLTKPLGEKKGLRDKREKRGLGWLDRQV